MDLSLALTYTCSFAFGEVALMCIHLLPSSLAAT